jgi:hypothetical protein
MNVSRAIAPAPDEPAAPPHRPPHQPPDRPPIGRFLLLFGGLLAAALSLAALAPERRADPQADITEPVPALGASSDRRQNGHPRPLPSRIHNRRNPA